MHMLSGHATVDLALVDRHRRRRRPRGSFGGHRCWLEWRNSVLELRVRSLDAEKLCCAARFIRCCAGKLVGRVFCRLRCVITAVRGVTFRLAPSARGCRSGASCFTTEQWFCVIRIFVRKRIKLFCGK